MDGTVTNPRSHTWVREAVPVLAADPWPGTMLEVSRQLSGGQLLLDATGSEPENLRITTAAGPVGLRPC